MTTVVAFVQVDVPDTVEDPWDFLAGKFEVAGDENKVLVTGFVQPDLDRKSRNLVLDTVIAHAKG